MLCSHMLVAQALRLFRGHVQDALALRAQRHFHRGGNPLANRNARFNLFPNGFDGALLPQETVGQRFVFPHQTQQEVLGLDVRAAVLAGLVPGEKYDAPRLLCVSFEHD